MLNWVRQMITKFDNLATQNGDGSDPTVVKKSQPIPVKDKIDTSTSTDGDECKKNENRKSSLQNLVDICQNSLCKPTYDCLDPKAIQHVKNVNIINENTSLTDNSVSDSNDNKLNNTRRKNRFGNLYSASPSTKKRNMALQNSTNLFKSTYDYLDVSSVQNISKTKINGLQRTRTRTYISSDNSDCDDSESTNKRQNGQSPSSSKNQNHFPGYKYNYIDASALQNPPKTKKLHKRKARIYISNDNYNSEDSEPTTKMQNDYSAKSSKNQVMLVQNTILDQTVNDYDNSADLRKVKRINKNKSKNLTLTINSNFDPESDCDNFRRNNDKNNKKLINQSSKKSSKKLNENIPSKLTYDHMDSQLIQYIRTKRVKRRENANSTSTDDSDSDNYKRKNRFYNHMTKSSSRNSIMVHQKKNTKLMNYTFSPQRQFINDQKTFNCTDIDDCSTTDSDSDESNRQQQTYLDHQTSNHHRELGSDDDYDSHSESNMKWTKKNSNFGRRRQVSGCDSIDIIDFASTISRDTGFESISSDIYQCERLTISDMCRISENINENNQLICSNDFEMNDFDQNFYCFEAINNIDYCRSLKISYYTITEAFLGNLKNHNDVIENLSKKFYHFSIKSTADEIQESLYRNDNCYETIPEAGAKLSETREVNHYVVDSEDSNYKILHELKKQPSITAPNINMLTHPKTTFRPLQELSSLTKRNIEQLRYILRYRENMSYNINGPKAMAIFGNSLEIDYKTKLFYDDLNTKSNLKGIIDVFHQSEEVFQLYVDYAANYSYAKTVLNEMITDVLELGHLFEDDVGLDSRLNLLFKHLVDYISILKCIGKDLHKNDLSYAKLDKVILMLTKKINLIESYL